jgi:4-carboxymuconolactone decarboxylase
MSTPDFSRPRAAARAFTPKLAALVEQPLFSEMWADRISRRATARSQP